MLLNRKWNISNKKLLKKKGFSEKLWRRFFLKKSLQNALPCAINRVPCADFDISTIIFKEPKKVKNEEKKLHLYYPTRSLPRHRNELSSTEK